MTRYKLLSYPGCLELWTIIFCVGKHKQFSGISIRVELNIYNYATYLEIFSNTFGDGYVRLQYQGSKTQLDSWKAEKHGAPLEWSVTKQLGSSIHRFSHQAGLESSQKELFKFLSKKS